MVGLFRHHNEDSSFLLPALGQKWRFIDVVRAILLLERGEPANKCCVCKRLAGEFFCAYDPLKQCWSLKRASCFCGVVLCCQLTTRPCTASQNLGFLFEMR